MMTKPTHGIKMSDKRIIAKHVLSMRMALNVIGNN